MTLLEDLLRDLDRQEKNRNKFVAEAVRRELARRRRVELRRSFPKAPALLTRVSKNGRAGCRRKIASHW